MNKIIISGRLNGMWKNGLNGKKRGLNLIIVDYSTVFKTTLWQEDADYAEGKWSIGDEIKLVGECSGIWENEKNKAIEIKNPKVKSVNLFRADIAELRPYDKELDQKES